MLRWHGRTQRAAGGVLPPLLPPLVPGTPAPAQGAQEADEAHAAALRAQCCFLREKLRVVEVRAGRRGCHAARFPASLGRGTCPHPGGVDSELPLQPGRPARPAALASPAACHECDAEHCGSLHLNVPPLCAQLQLQEATYTAATVPALLRAAEEVERALAEAAAQLQQVGSSCVHGHTALLLLRISGAP